MRTRHNIKVFNCYIAVTGYKPISAILPCPEKNEPPKHFYICKWKIALNWT